MVHPSKNVPRCTPYLSSCLEWSCSVRIDLGLVNLKMKSDEVRMRMTVNYNGVIRILLKKA
jgi:hypothetical protein